MPNHVKNIVQIKGPQAKKVLEAVRGDSEQAFDFEKIIPMPDILRGFEPHSGVVDAVKVAYKVPKKFGFETYRPSKKPEDEEAIAHGCKAYEETGYVYWYDWAYDNWDTKWNAYDIDIISDTCVAFNTAWSTPAKVIQRLSEMFPRNTIIVDWADEDIGSNTGQLTFKAGEVISEVVPESGSAEAYEHAFEVMPDYRDMFELVDGEYRYIEE